MKRKIKPNVKVFVPFGGIGYASFDMTALTLKCPNNCDMEIFLIKKFGFIVPHIHFIAFNDSDITSTFWALTDKVYIYEIQN